MLYPSPALSSFAILKKNIIDPKHKGQDNIRFIKKKIFLCYLFVKKYFTLLFCSNDFEIKKMTDYPQVNR